MHTTHFTKHIFKMRPSLLIIISLLSFHLLYSAQGIRMLKSSFKQEIIQENAVLAMTSNGGDSEEAILCIEGHCSSGKNRKLMTPITTSAFTTKTTSELQNFDNGANEAGDKQGNISDSSRPAADVGRKVEPSKYEDTMDMTEMDYSSAKRKPPIHN